MPDPAREDRGFLSAPLLALSCAFALGIAPVDAQAETLAATLAIVPWLLAFAGLCMLAGLMLTRTRRPRLAGLLALAGFILSGNAAARLFEFRSPRRHVSHLEDLGIDLRDAVRVSGRVVSTPLATPSGTQFDLALTAVEDRGRTQPMSGTVRLRLRPSEENLSGEGREAVRLDYGDSIRTLASLELPRVYRNPGVFSYRRWLAAIQDIYQVGTIKSPLLVEKLQRAGSTRLDEILNRVRQNLLQAVDNLYPPWSRQGRYGSVLKAVMLGDRSSLDTETIDHFRVTGLYHLLVISGMNVALLAMLAGLFLGLFPIGKTTQSVLVLLFVLGYGSLVEPSAPTLRATVMVALYLVARYFYRQHAALNAVGLAALVLLVARPTWLFESGFELSFAAALLIVALVGPILARATQPTLRALRRVEQVGLDAALAPRQAQLRIDVRRAAAWLAQRIPFLRGHAAASTAMIAWPLWAGMWTAEILLFTAILQIALILPMAATFHRVTYAGIGLNALAIPLMTVLMALALPTMLLGAVSTALAAWPAKLLALFMRGLFALTDLPHLPGWLSYRVPTPPAWVAWGFALSILAATWSLGRSRRAFWAFGACLMVFAALISIDPMAPRVPRGRLEVTALDCGPGDAFFVVLPDRTTLLVGAGGRANARAPSEDPFESRRWSEAEEIISPYLWSRQIKKLDVVVMSHGDESRLPGFAAIARNFRIGEWWYAPAGLEPAARGFLDGLEERGIRVRAIQPGERMARGYTTIQLLWPQGSGSSGAASPSSAGPGMAIRIQDGESGILLGGDLSARAQQALLASPAALRAPLLALAAPPSPDGLTPEFAAGVSPRVVLVSGGAEDAEAVATAKAPAMLQASGARVYHTTRVGAVTAELREGGIRVRTYGMPAGEGTLGRASAAAFTSSSRSVR